MGKGKRAAAVLAVLILAGIGGCGSHERQDASQPTGWARTPSTQTPSTPKEDKGQGIICNRFDLKHELTGNSLRMWIETDLPDSTEVMMGVSRCFYEKGSSSAYPVDYFSEKSTVGKWRTPRALTLDDAKWRAKLDERQRILARAGAAIEITRIDDNVELSAVVPINQSDPRFGEQNANLTGEAVPTSGMRVISREIDMGVPMPSASAAAAETTPVWADPRNLHVGKTYDLSKDTPLMPEFEPADPMQALGRMKQIRAGGTITVVGQRDKGGTPWYEVNARQANGAQLGRGWINSLALLGQDIKEAKER